jgi:osmotically-inducible protein OsmY
MEPTFAAHKPHQTKAPVAVGSFERIEQRVRRELLSQSEWQFDRLVVRRTPGGVCLEGVVRSRSDVDEAADVTTWVRQVAGVSEVLNNLVVWNPPARTV